MAGGGGQTTRVSVGDSGGVGGSTWQCQFVHATGVGVGSEPFTPQVGERALFVCYDGGRLVSIDARTYDPADPLAGLFAAERAMAAARRRVDPPRPALRTNPAAEQLVGVPTWLWLAGGYAPVSATASVGAVSATVTAAPTGVSWDTGDGTVVRCGGAGRPWSPGLDDDASDCRHTFEHRSTTTGADGTFTVRATVTYAVTWTATTGQGGDLGTITRTATVDVRVREAQAAIR
ncbi:MAG: hypothetical protein U0Q07_01600 [Acidimicrobiales bacterium]